MATVERPWTDHEIARMHPWYTRDGLSISEIGRRLGRTKNMVTAKINRLREAEGTERWPERGSPIKHGTTRTKRARVGRTTLPPLASLA
jgi:transposase